VTELPGVEKDDIQLESTDRALKIAVESAKRRYFKELELPHLVDPRTAIARYKNGVLEVRFKKSDEKRRTRAIQVELAKISNASQLCLYVANSCDAFEHLAAQFTM